MIHPVGNRIVAKKMDIEQMESKGGIILPQTHQTDTHKAEVIAVGDEITKCKAGDIILHTVFKGDNVEHEQENFIILEEEDILAIIDRN